MNPQQLGKLTMNIELDDSLSQGPDTIKFEHDGITLYESAYNKLFSLLTSKTDKTLRITLEPGGCAGLSYKALLDIPTDVDKVIAFDDTVKIIVSDKKRFPADDDPSTLFSDWDFLDGLHLKFEESIMSSHFVMDNPHAVRGCSCGISFKPKGYGGKPKSCH